jgi:hypothetical protein
VTGGVTVTGGGLYVTGGMTVADGGASVMSGGLLATGGLTIFGGFKSIGTLSINGNAVVTGGMSVSSGTLVVTGSMTVDKDLTVISAASLSDARLKIDVVRIQEALDKVSTLSGFYYDWIKDFGLDEDRHIGVFAQDVQKVLPEAVAEIFDGYLGVKYDEIIPVLIESVKELDGMISDLENLSDRLLVELNITE